MSDDRYLHRGVSASKSDVHAAIKNLDKGLFPLAFCKILPDVIAGNPDYCNVMHADTAGTKTSLAYLYWKETGDLSVWKGVVQDALVMNLDDLACVGCIDDIVISSTIGRNGKLIPAEVLKVIIQAAQEFVEQMATHGIHLHHSGGETADVGDIVRTVDIGFTTFGRLSKADLVINRIKDGDVIIGFSSSGHCSYESEYNGGMGSNGLTSARHDVLNKSYAEKYPESFDPHVDPQYVYAGTKQLTDKIQIGAEQIPIGKLILSPTRTYLPMLKPLLQEYRKEISGLIHCTGGAQSKVKKFIDKKHIIKDQCFDIPPLFELIQKESNSTYKEMYQVFNMGHRLECYIPEKHAKGIMQIARKFDIETKIIGRVEDAAINKVTIETPTGTVEY